MLWSHPQDEERVQSVVGVGTLPVSRGPAPAPAPSASPDLELPRRTSAASAVGLPLPLDPSRDNLRVSRNEREKESERERTGERMLGFLVYASYQPIVPLPSALRLRIRSMHFQFRPRVSYDCTPLCPSSPTAISPSKYNMNNS
jgi:hypothetical protein